MFVLVIVWSHLSVVILVFSSNRKHFKSIFILFVDLKFEFNSQVVFLDTPGVVSKEEATKFNLEESLLVDPVSSCQGSDLILVVQVRISQNKWFEIEYK